MSETSFKQSIDDFWKLSVSFYELTASKLLILQNSADKNINRMLFSLWFGYRQKRLLKPREVSWINQYCHPIEMFIAQLRQLRFHYQTQFEKPYPVHINKTRNRLLACELYLEKRHQQNMLMILLTKNNDSLDLDAKLPFSQLYERKLITYAPSVHISLLEIDRQNLESLCGSLQHSSSLNYSYEDIIQDWYDFLAEMS